MLKGVGAELVASIIFGATSVSAHYDGNQLLALCQNKSPDFCLGYIAGIAEAMAGGPVGKWVACVPPRLTFRQLTDITMQLLNDHPELRHHAAASLVAKALSEAFPCPPAPVSPSPGVTE